MRMYEPIWNALKRDSKIVVTAPPAQHRRVIKAVIKEKDSDTVFKLQCSEINLSCKLSYTVNRENHQISFSIAYYGIGEI